VNHLDIASLGLEVVADFDAGITCEQPDELRKIFLEVSLKKICETLLSLMIFLSQWRPSHYYAVNS